MPLCLRGMNDSDYNTIEIFDCCLTRFSPNEVPQYTQRYSYKSPSGKTSSNRSRTGDDCRHLGQNSSVALKSLYCDGCCGRCPGGYCPDGGINGFIMRCPPPLSTIHYLISVSLYSFSDTSYNIGIAKRLIKPHYIYGFLSRENAV